MRSIDLSSLRLKFEIVALCLIVVDFSLWSLFFSLFNAYLEFMIGDLDKRESSTRDHHIM